MFIDLDFEEGKYVEMLNWVAALQRKKGQRETKTRQKPEMREFITVLFV